MGRAVSDPASDLVCEAVAVAPKDDLGTMEHPVFSLSTRPDRRILSYEHNGIRVDVTPSVKGRATIHDKDVLIYCVSQLMAAMNAGRPLSRTLRMRARDLLLDTGRETSGDAYRRLREALERLAGTRVTTNYVTGGAEVTEGFGLIEGWRVVRREADGRMVSVSITLSEWLYRAVLARAVLTLSRDYFALRRPLERRLYEIVRKHCGRQKLWRVSVTVLHKKSGSASPKRAFRAALRETIAADRLPDYVLEEEPGDVIRVRPRKANLSHAKGPGPLLHETIERVRARMPGADVYALEALWRSETTDASDPDAAFLEWSEVYRSNR